MMGGGSMFERNKFLSKLLLICLFLMSTLFLVTPASVVAQEQPFSEKRVLFISSYSPSFNTFYQQIEGINDMFDGYPVTVDMEFMDTKRFYNDENIGNFLTSITYKMTEVDYDLILVSDDNGLNFVMDHQNDLFDEIPIIFFGINNIENGEMYSANPYVTGVIERVSMFETIEIGVTLNPDATKVIAIYDATPSGQADFQNFMKEEELFPNHQFDSIDLSKMSWDEFFVELAKVEDDSIILLLAALRDENNDVYDFDKSLSLIKETTDIQIYHLYEHGIGNGVFGGKVVSHYVQGKTAAAMALRVFSGDNIQNIALIENSPNVYMFDYELLDMYYLDPDDFPENTVFVNEELTIFEEYGVYIYFGILVLIFMMLSIGLLILMVINRNKARLAALESKNELEIMNKKLEFSSYFDYLTGLNNRNYFEEVFPRIDHIDNYPISLVLADVNGLKLLNDAFGHLVGDKALVEAARILKETFNESEVARIGGDEFAVFSTKIPQSEVYQKMGEIRKKCSEIEIEAMKLSLSLGYAVKDDESTTFNEIFTEAEDWMYREKLSQVPSNRSAMIDTIIATINQKDIYSEVHSKRVSQISMKIGELLSLDANTINDLKTAGLLHDIGKIVVPSHILTKKGKLTDSEFAEIKKHSEIGYRILNSVSSMRDIAQYVFSHHERIDGKGYPRGLKGDEISLQARIISVADALDAMLADRLYRNKLSIEKCKLELVNNKGTQFDEDIVDVVVEHIDEIEKLINSW